MKVSITVIANLKIKEVIGATTGATRKGIRDTLTDTMADSIKGSPILSGNNRRSIKMEVSGTGGEGIVNHSKNEGALYSTSGYGGYLETGTVNMSARPYFKPAGDRHFPKLPEAIKRHMK